MPHLDAAYNLARWLTRNDHDAEDVVQEAFLRAHQFFDGFHGGDGRAWLLAIVRNTCYTWLERNRPRAPAIAFDDDKHSAAGARCVRSASASAFDSARHPSTASVQAGQSFR